ncbi:hypothetical protein JB92DRAFT_3002549 [Gautieria morchelliformis]|nr:hypothetical protein JB92DRAFT_3002549 [Gautieria morchelliformis]
MRRLLAPNNRMVSMTPSKTPCYISNLNIFLGVVDPTDSFILHLLSIFFPHHCASLSSCLLSFHPSPGLNSTPKPTNPSFASAPLRS